MKFSARQYAQALYEAVASTSSKDLNQVLDNFVKVLVENNDLRLFDEIAKEFHKTELKSKGVTEAEVISARPLNAENEKQILDVLNEYVKGKVELRNNLDENLVGGVVIQVDDLMIDASVKNGLEQLRNELST